MGLFNEYPTSTGRIIALVETQKVNIQNLEKINRQEAIQCMKETLVSKELLISTIRLERHPLLECFSNVGGILSSHLQESLCCWAFLTVSSA
jgi:hypothetical protein